MKKLKMLLIRRKKLRALGLLLALNLVFCSSAFAIGNIHFNEPGASTGTKTTDILNENDSAISSGDLQRGSNKVELFYGSGASNPTTNSDVPAGDLESFDPNYPRKYVFNKFGHNINFRVWSGSPHTKGSYFGYGGLGYKVSGNQTSYSENDLGAQESLNDGTQNVPSYLVVKGFQTNRKYDNPYQPSVGNFTESYVRVSGTDDVDLNLTVTSSYTQNQGGIIIPATSYNWEVWRDGDEGNKMAFSGATLNLTTNEVDPGNKYWFRVKAFNWFPNEGSPWSQTKDYTLLPIGGIAGGASTFTFDLKKIAGDKVIVNSIAVPSTTLATGDDVSDAEKLAAYINAKAGANVVTAISKWDPEIGSAVGATFGDDGSRISGDNFAIQPGVGYQVFTKEDISGISFPGQ